MTERFWMVYGDGQNAPTYKHDTRENAEDEARRLARNVPGVSFYALEAVSCARKQDVMFTRLDADKADDGIPF